MTDSTEKDDIDCSLIGFLIIAIFIGSLISFICGGMDADTPWKPETKCFQSTAPIKKYNPVYLGACWLFEEKRTQE